MPHHPDSVIADLIDGKLEWTRTKEIISHPKDPCRFDQVVRILQRRVPWSEPIVLPLAEHLFIVSKNRTYIIKCDCGFEFGDYRQNWKHQARVALRDTVADLQDLYRPYEHADPSWMELREFFCPGCYALLEVEAVPPGYPVMHDFVPDLEAFYQEVLGRQLPE